MMRVILAEADSDVLLADVIQSSSGLCRGLAQFDIIGTVNTRLPAVAVEEGVRFVDTFAAMNDPALYGVPTGTSFFAY